MLDFADRVAAHRQALGAAIRTVRTAGGRVAAISAPAKGMTLLNVCGLGPELEFVTERSALKIGKFCPGSYLPVLPDTALLQPGITHGLILAWNFGPEIQANIERMGFTGQFIIPIPWPTIQRSAVPV